MSASAGPDLITDGLNFLLDATDPKSFQGGSTITDVIGGNVGTFAGAITQGSNYLSTDGISSRVEITMPNTQTLSIFVKVTDETLLGGFDNIIIGPQANGSDNGMYITDNGYFTIFITELANVGNNTLSSNVNVNDGLFHYLTTTIERDSTSVIRSYIDGEFINSKDRPYLIAEWGGFTRIGARGNNTKHLAMDFSCIHGYDRLLSEEEIRQNYQAIKSRFQL